MAALVTASTGPEASPAAAQAPPNRPKPASSIFDLPPETQREIFGHADLICLALVCRRFHQLASAQLYRNFHIIFPDDDDVNFDSPIDGLAGGLDTFTTSEYNYAQHLRDLSMDTLSAGLKGEQSYQPYLYSASCGKFLNTLLRLTLKRAHHLESFRWNIRVELSRPVYAQLHRIRALKKLHVRLQAGDSYYTPPPPLPMTIDGSPHAQPSHAWHDSFSPLHSSGPPPPSSSAHLLRHSSKGKSAKRGQQVVPPSTFSGFKGLQTLSVLDIDNLDVIPELTACIKRSSSTLREVQLSLSDALAQRSRKPVLDSDVDDSDIEEDFQLAPTSGEDNGDNEKVLGVPEERDLQEAILARIFDLEGTHVIKKPSTPPPTSFKTRLAMLSSMAESGPDIGDPREDFIASIRTLSSRLMAAVHGSKEFLISQQEILNVIEKAARKYVASTSTKDSLHGAADDAGRGSPSLVSCADARTIGHIADSRLEVPFLDLNDQRDDGSSQPSRSGTIVLPDTDDVVHGGATNGRVDEIRDALLGQGLQTAESAAGEGPSHADDEMVMSTVNKSVRAGTSDEPAASSLDGQDLSEIDAKLPNSDRGAIVDKLIQLHQLVHDVANRVLEIRDERLRQPTSVVASTLDVELVRLNRSAIEVSNEIRILESEIEGLLLSSQKSDGGMTKEHIDTYKRETRGMSIQTLKICLVPVKASVLSQAIDVTCIKELTLLNVGNQAPIWSMLTKELKKGPIALRSVFTDHVSASFLTCMAKLPQLDDLLMLERGLRHKPESFAPRTATSINQIRRLVLKRHMPTLKRLMIKDDHNYSTWDANEKTMILICTRGVQLEELAVSLNIKALHAFMQYFAKLVNLRALHVLHFRNNDTCTWVRREILRFIVDNLSHHPEMKLEWIAIEGDRVDRVVRPSDYLGLVGSTDATESRKDKDADMILVPNTSSSPYPPLPLDAFDSESDSEEDETDGGSRLRFRTIGPLQFYDVWGVKIFQKEIRRGKL